MTEAASDALHDLQAMCSRYDQLEAEIATDERQLKVKKEEMNRLRMDVIPELFHELGIQDLTLASGVKVKVSRGVDASITNDNRVAAHNWLREHGYEGIIKTEVDVQFDVGDFDEAHQLYRDLADRYAGAFLQERVHPMTLKSFVRERLEAGDDLPLELFGARSYQIAKIER